MKLLCHLEDIPDRDARGFEFHGETLVVVRQGDEVFVYRNQCPHLGIELNFQPDVFLDSDGEFIQCANHGALFRIEDGYCLAGPCSGQSLETIAHELRGNEIHVQA